ncbi:MAG: type IV conjugative transfer system lipoprotein TraV [Chloroflexi bacterium]|nr:type IV conjugative transfer system lipoprotein TraV [Chloroflexota bacterium]
MKSNIQQITGTPLRAFAMLLGVLLLAGCAGGSHVGESWQCPIAQGTACASVSEADPAVMSRAEVLEMTPSSSIRSTETTGTAFLSGILAWFVELIRLDEGDDGEVATAEPLFVLTAAEEIPDEANENLRTKERVARIWIAPYVDSSGVYREAGWVWVVVEPARWRLP